MKRAPTRILGLLAATTEGVRFNRVNLKSDDVVPSVIRGGAASMDSIEYYQERADECARLAKSAGDRQLQAALLSRMKIYLRVVARSAITPSGKAFQLTPARKQWL